MDIKSEVKNLVVYARSQQDAVALGNHREIAYYGKFVRESLDAIDRWADMAEAALAYMEHQAATVHDPDECDLEYSQQRAKLWDAYMSARAKVKAITQQ